MNDRGTRIIIYNLWEDDQGMLELDFDADPHVRVFVAQIMCEMMQKLPYA